LKIENKIDLIWIDNNHCTQTPTNQSILLLTMSELLQLENGYDKPELIIMASALGKCIHESSLKDDIINELRTDNFNGKIDNLELQKVIEDLKKTIKFEKEKENIQVDEWMIEELKKRDEENQKTIEDNIHKYDELKNTIEELKKTIEDNKNKKGNKITIDDDTSRSTSILIKNVTPKYIKDETKTKDIVGSDILSLIIDGKDLFSYPHINSLPAAFKKIMNDSIHNNNIIKDDKTKCIEFCKDLFDKTKIKYTEENGIKYFQPFGYGLSIQFISGKYMLQSIIMLIEYLKLKMQLKIKLKTGKILNIIV
jgi:hypothetical protein